MKTCAFTGHRPKGLGYPELDERCAALKEKLRALIIRMIEEEGVTHFISGMAQGVDMYAAEIVLELKKQDPQITLECAIPYERQAVRWPEALRNRYFSIAERLFLLHFQGIRPENPDRLPGFPGIPHRLSRPTGTAVPDGKYDIRMVYHVAVS